MPITELEYMEKYIGDFKINGSEYVAKYCPFCNGGVHNDKYTFSLSAENHCYICHRGKCEATGSFSELAQTKGETTEYFKKYWKKNDGVNTIPTVKKKKEYVRPKFQLTEADSDIVNYFKNRGISEDVTKKYVYTATAPNGRKVAAFKFFNGNEHCLTKFRYINKDAKVKETQEKDGLSVLWNFQNIDKTKPVILTEGMIDALSCIEAGHENVVSVPSGCQNFKWLENNYDEIQKINNWILYMDNDDAGDKMKEELILKLGADKISVVNHDLKDANDELNIYGKAFVSHNIKSAKKIPVDGLLNIADVKIMDLSKAEKTSTGIDFLDRILGGFMYPSLNVWTGKRGEGKSTMLIQTLITAMSQNVNCFVFSAELNVDLFKLWLYRQIATERHLVETFDERTCQISYEVPKAVINAIDKWVDNKLFIYDTMHANNEDEILRLMETAYKRNNCRIFVVDNLATVRLNPIIGGKYEAQSEFTNRLREFAIKHKVNVSLVVHPRKTTGAGFDNDTVGGSGDITNLAFSVIYIRRIKDPIKDLTESEIDSYKKMNIELENIDAVLEVTKNRYFGINQHCPLQFNIKDTRYNIYNQAGHIVKDWEKYLPDGYKDTLGKIYNKCSQKPVTVHSVANNSKRVIIQENELTTEEELLLEGLELVELPEDSPF